MNLASPPNISRRWREGGRFISGRLVGLRGATKRPVRLAGRAAGRNNRLRVTDGLDGRSNIWLFGRCGGNLDAFWRRSASGLDGLAAAGLAALEIRRVKRLAGSSLSTRETGPAGGRLTGALGTAAGTAGLQRISRRNRLCRAGGRFQNRGRDCQSRLLRAGPQPFQDVSISLFQAVPAPILHSNPHRAC